jgi:hypothetical protein
MDGFVDRLHALRFLRACDPSYRALTFTLAGLSPTGYISLLLDILFGSFLRAFGRQQTTVYSGQSGRHCYEIRCFLTTPDGWLVRYLLSDNSGHILT